MSNIDWWSIQVPTPVALAAVAVIGYLVSRWNRAPSNDAILRSRRELKRAQTIAAELERITWTVSQSLTAHQNRVARFRDRVARLEASDQGTSWGDLCREADAILKPTLQLASQIAGAYDEIRQQGSQLMTFTEVRTDSLTRVFNRRGLDDTLRTHFALMSRYHSVFSLAIFDIDHFKDVNDREGHVHGDRVLQELATLLDECVRDTDLVARYGGEEFVVVMPQTELNGACALAERLRAIIANRMSVTVSGGVTVATEEDSAESLVARADVALYNAKTAGRNRVFARVGQESRPIEPEKLSQPERSPHAEAAESATSAEQSRPADTRIPLAGMPDPMSAGSPPPITMV